MIAAADAGEERKNNRPALMESSFPPISLSFQITISSYDNKTWEDESRRVRCLGFYGVYSNAHRVKLF